ncbi:MAG: hypothetical protein WC894_03350 [Patescibacteria group bacterium]
MVTVESASSKIKQTSPYFVEISKPFIFGTTRTKEKPKSNLKKAPVKK